MINVENNNIFNSFNDEEVIRKDAEITQNNTIASLPDEISSEMNNNLIPPEAYENEVRDLADLEGKTIQVSAYFTRYGHIDAVDRNSNKNISNITLLLKKPYTFVDGEYRLIASHCWLTNNTSLQKCRLHHGDKVTFFATVKKYVKRSGKEDYTFIDIHNASVLQRNPVPLKMGIFEFDAPLVKKIIGFTSFKGEAMNLYQNKIVVNGERYSVNDNISFRFKLKDIDKNGTFRFYYKTPNSNSWTKYAYFFPNKGQKIFFITGSNVSRMLIDEKNYYALKDAYSDFAYAGNFHFPVKSRNIIKLAKNDSLPDRMSCCWESRRIKRKNKKEMTIC